eukprot:gnl/TRDRNA2_/TRDRNA2_80820_c1_seq1.p1 gnl/TRDRNA2_/TRDRNA2_80820_c1~~gnl/TRDRNA2_/TRDRNA2_80820_c1_seq1.p1  ORF type:complete len:232 (-),score=35.47 gnl/TRDRNA2_/TRDRNA2_80820_c1_seq1:132-827(-)
MLRSELDTAKASQARAIEQAALTSTELAAVQEEKDSLRTELAAAFSAADSEKELAAAKEQLQSLRAELIAARASADCERAGPISGDSPGQMAVTVTSRMRSSSPQSSSSRTLTRTQSPSSMHQRVQQVRTSPINQSNVANVQTPPVRESTALDVSRLILMSGGSKRSAGACASTPALATPKMSSYQYPVRSPGKIIQSPMPRPVARTSLPGTAAKPGSTLRSSSSSQLSRS